MFYLYLCRLSKRVSNKAYRVIIAVYEQFYKLVQHSKPERNFAVSLTWGSLQLVKVNFSAS